MLGIRQINGVAIDLWQGDICCFVADAIATAANEQLAGGGGVDAAIHLAAGPSLLEQCRKLAPCPPGQAVVTKAGNLPAKIVIHAVGPIWQGGTSAEFELLSSCYRNCLNLAEQHRCRHIAIPAISTGVYGFPLQLAARCVFETLQALLLEQPFEVLKRVTLVCFDKNSHNHFFSMMQEVLQEQE